jgi:hypothetical protein
VGAGAFGGADERLEGEELPGSVTLGLSRPKPSEKYSASDATSVNVMTAIVNFSRPGCWRTTRM